MHAYQTRFLKLALQKNVLKFGRFELKSGRTSPYFFNAGLFDDGQSLTVLGECYAEALVESGLQFDMVFGPAYKGIPLGTALCTAYYHRQQQNLPLAFNRKEAKDHGEGGQLVGAPLKGRVLIIDDVISAGTSVRESIGWIHEAGATVAGVAIALDRQERGTGDRSAAQEMQESEKIPVVSIANLDQLVNFLGQTVIPGVDLDEIKAYRKRYGV